VAKAEAANNPEAMMRGTDSQQASFFSYISPEQRVPKDIRCE